VTLSGFLNFVDGLWSTSGEERIIICTTVGHTAIPSTTPAPPPYAYDSKPTVWLSLNPAQVHTC
jgi:hypothetical protein